MQSYVNDPKNLFTRKGNLIVKAIRNGKWCSYIDIVQVLRVCFRRRLYFWQNREQANIHDNVSTRSKTSSRIHRKGSNRDGRLASLLVVRRGCKCSLICFSWNIFKVKVFRESTAAGQDSARSTLWNGLTFYLETTTPRFTGRVQETILSSSHFPSLIIHWTFRKQTRGPCIRDIDAGNGQQFHHVRSWIQRRRERRVYPVLHASFEWSRD